MAELENQALPLAIRTNQSDLVDKIKPEQVVEIIRHKLLGEEFIDGEWRAVSYLKDFAISEKGAWEISALMLSVCSQNVVFGKLTNSQILKRAFEITKAALLLSCRNWKEYKIKSITQLRFIAEIVFSNSLIALTQSEDAGMRRVIGQITSEIRTITTTAKEEKGGFMDALNKLRGKV